MVGPALPMALPGMGMDGLAGIAMKALLGDRATLLEGLRPVHVAEQWVTVLSTHSKEALILLEESGWLPLLQGWRQAHPPEDVFPVLLVTANFIELRTRQPLLEQALCEQFIELGRCVVGALHRR